MSDVTFTANGQHLNVGAMLLIIAGRLQHITTHELVRTAR